MSYEEFAESRRVTLLGFILGPLALFPATFPGALALTLAAVALTLVTQVGGVLLWLSIPVLDAVYRRFNGPGARFAALAFAFLTFFVLYAVTTLLVVPELATLSGRVALPCGSTATSVLQPATKWTCFLSRRYVVPALRDKLEALAVAMDAQFPGQIVYYLDAGFPFWKGFPMLPHLSHKDGRKADLAFAYQVDVDGRLVMAGPPAALGYWRYEQPTAEEEQPCRGKKSPKRWAMAWLQPKPVPGTPAVEPVMDAEKTAAMLGWLLAEGNGTRVKRILLETHLKTRLGVEDERVRFQGCKAARHDDHFHLEI